MEHIKAAADTQIVRKATPEDPCKGCGGWKYQVVYGPEELCSSCLERAGDVSAARDDERART